MSWVPDCDLSTYCSQIRGACITILQQYVQIACITQSSSDLEEYDFLLWKKSPQGTRFFCSQCRFYSFLRTIFKTIWLRQGAGKFSIDSDNVSCIQVLLTDVKRRKIFGIEAFLACCCKSNSCIEYDTGKEIWEEFL